jgi:threonine dehydrogenase-like Zn-dependent dehydrogenase
VSVVGVSQSQAFPLHLQLAQFNELEISAGLCSVQRELPALLALTASGRIRPEAVISHRMGLSEGVEAYATFHGRGDGVSKVVLDPSR